MSNAPIFVDDDGANVTKTQNPPNPPNIVHPSGRDGHVGGSGGYIRAEARPGVVGALSSSSSATGGCVNGSNSGGGSSRTQSAAKSLPSAAPLLLPTLGAPFGGGTTSRKKAYTAAVFHGECHLAGIPADDAEDAATGVSATHRRFWVEALHRNKSGRSSGGGGGSSSGAFDDDSSNSSLGDHRSPGGPRSAERAKKARRHSSRTLGTDEDRARGTRERSIGVREVIDRVSRRQDEQGGGYISPVTVVSPSSADPTDESADDTDNGDGGRELEVAPSARTHSEGMPGKGFGSLSLSPRISASARRKAVEAKSSLLSSLSGCGGDMATPAFRSALQVLESYYASTGRDARRSAFTSSSRLSHEGIATHSSKSSLTAAEPSGSFCRDADLEGTWLSLSRPDYQGCLGTNDRSHYIYTLGRMTFDMFRPTHLRCSIQGEFNAVRVVDGSEMLPEYVPRRLRKEVLVSQHNGGRLRTYNIIVAFVIEPNQNRKGKEIPLERKEHEKGKEKEQHIITRPIRGIMTNLGYMLPDPKVPNRMSIWFTEGTLEVNDEEADLEEWKRIFDGHRAPKRDLRERAHVLAAKILLGANVPDTMEEDGTLSYSLKRPIGGHGLAFCDVLYLDDDLRILRGHHGQLYVSARVLTKQPTAVPTADRDLPKALPFQVSA